MASGDSDVPSIVMN